MHSLAPKGGTMKRSRFVVVAAALLLSACASTRGVQVGTEPNRVFAIEVTSNRAGTVTVSYTAHGISGELGTVAPRMPERFVIAMTEPGQITVVAKTTSGA